jgi:spore coat-associated protein N
MDQFDTVRDTAPARRRRRRRMLVAMLLASSLATVGAGAMSLAVFTNSTDASGDWTTGSITLGVSPNPVFHVTGILPGDSGQQTLVVSNTGSGDLRYAMTSTSDNADGLGLAAQMQMTITDEACGTPGTTLYTGSLDGAFFGNPAQGADLNDQTVTVGNSQSLCFAWSFPLASDTTYQGATTTTTFSFDAEQTLHN